MPGPPVDYVLMPTHRDLPPGWENATATRRAQVALAEERARATRESLRTLVTPGAAEIQAADRARATTSKPPPA